MNDIAMNIYVQDFVQTYACNFVERIHRSGISGIHGICIWLFEELPDNSPKATSKVAFGEGKRRDFLIAL
jgi:hypothetical protein